MTKEEFIAETNVDENAIILEDWEVFSKGIIGVDEGGTRIVYGYYKLADALSKDYMEQDENLTQEDAMTMAFEWLDYNTLRSLAYLPAEYRPIIVYEVEQLF